MRALYMNMCHPGALHTGERLGTYSSWLQVALLQGLFCLDVALKVSGKRRVPVIDQFYLSLIAVFRVLLS